MNRFFYWLLAAVAIVSFSCSRDKEESFLPGATIQINTPVTGAVYHYGDTIYISATITGTDGLHGYEVAIREAGSNTNLYFQHHHEHAPVLQVAEKWKNDLNKPTQMQADIIAILDDTGRRKIGTVLFQIHN